LQFISSTDEKHPSQPQSASRDGDHGSEHGLAGNDPAYNEEPHLTDR
jgi:hypothetical protein